MPKSFNSLGWIFFVATALALGATFIYSSPKEEEIPPYNWQAEVECFLEEQALWEFDRALLEDHSQILQARVEDLEGQLLHQEQIWDQVNLTLNQKTEDVVSETQEEEEPVNQEDLVERFNQVLKNQRQFEWVLQYCTGVQDGVAQNVTFHQVNLEGVVNGAVSASTMRLALPPVPGALWLLLEEGERITQGEKRELGEEVFRIELAPVDIQYWKNQLPEFFVSSQREELSEFVSVEGSYVRRLLERTNRLLKRAGNGKCRWLSVDRIEKGEAFGVVWEERRGEDSTKTYRAGRVQFRGRAGHPGLEVIFFNGQWTQNEKSLPFPAYGYRVLVPGVSLHAWKSVGGPLTP